MAQVETRVAASARYLVRIIVHPRIVSEMLKQFTCFLFCLGRNECSPDGTGSPDRDSFAGGMVRIDEELRKAQLLGRASAGRNAASAARALRPVPSRPILR